MRGRTGANCLRSPRAGWRTCISGCRISGSCCRTPTRRASSATLSWIRIFSAPERHRPLRARLIPVPERRRLNAQRTEIYVPLSAVVYFVIYPVQHDGVKRAFILPESQLHFLETVRRYLRPAGADLRGYVIPAPEQRFFCKPVQRSIKMVQVADGLPLACYHAFYTGAGQVYHFQRHFSERTHAAQGEPEELVFRESGYYTAGKLAVPLPVLQQGFGRDDQGGRCCRNSVVCHC